MEISDRRYRHLNSNLNPHSRGDRVGLEDGRAWAAGLLHGSKKMDRQQADPVPGRPTWRDVKQVLLVDSNASILPCRTRARATRVEAHFDFQAARMQLLVKPPRFTGHEPSLQARAACTRPPAAAMPPVHCVREDDDPCWPAKCKQPAGSTSQRWLLHALVVRAPRFHLMIDDGLRCWIAGRTFAAAGVADRVSGEIDSFYDALAAGATFPAGFRPSV